MRNRQGRSLRLQLLSPIILLMILALGAVEWAQHAIAHRQTEQLIHRRGDTFRITLQGRLDERRNAQESFARMLSWHRDVAAAVQAKDTQALAALLGPLEAGMGLGYMAVYSKDGEPLLRLGTKTWVPGELELVSEALAGWTQSSNVSVSGGVMAIASAPVYGSADTVGAVLVGSYLGPHILSAFRSVPGEEVAVLRPGVLVAVTTDSPRLKDALEATGYLQPADLLHLNDRLAQLGLRAVFEPLRDDSVVVAIFPVDDILESARGVRNAVRAGMLLVTGLLILMGIHFARVVARPLEAMAVVTREVVGGNYRRRVAANAIRELDELASAFNHMAQQVEAQLDELFHQALNDPLTNLPNRKMLIERLQQALSRTGERANSVAVILLDLDNFKVINDSLGHPCGDQLLVQCARRLEQVLPPGGIAARQGGDEFCILLERMIDPTEANRVAERVNAAVREPFQIAGREIVVTASAGIAFGTPGEHKPDDLLKAADLAAYKVKNIGKDGCAVFDRTMSAAAMERLELESDLRRAMERDELVMWYQPVVDLGSGRIVELEALIRWQHPTRGLISPAEFIPLAEETGLIIPIGRWVLTAACRQAAHWLERHPGEALLVVSVNLSARQVHDRRLVEEVAQALAESHLPPACLKLEITESVMMHDAEATVRTLHRLKALGVRLAVDDFGQGYSSLSYLRRFPLDVLKIDRAFVEKLGQDPQDTAIVEAIIRLARTLNLTVTGEGVETGAQVQHLRSMGCELGQGYFFARPQPAAAIAELLAGAPLTIRP
ncbi:MAG TPA: EAL domain-containing protein [Symbiobacteriaceae bacterium]|nr:EAL domain-containing protein [Symbiobacteriaceae bacterium]